LSLYSLCKDGYMNLEEAKKTLKDGYVKAGLQLVDEHEKELFFKFVGDDVKTNICMNEQEILDFAGFDNIRSNFKVIPTECGICSSDYREQLVGFPEQSPRRYLPPRYQSFIFGNPQNGEIYAEIDKASWVFINFFRFEEAYLQQTLANMRMEFEINKDIRRKFTFQEMLPRPRTIKVYNLHKSSAEEALETSLPIVDACLFELTYLINITLVLEEEWPRRQPKIKPFSYGESFSGSQFPLKRVAYNPDIIRFYLRGMGSSDPFNKFLSLYQILEYFFISVSDEQLYQKLTQHINDPRFTTSPTYLDRIIQEVIEHKGESDETEMLKAVLNKFIDEKDLIEFIKAYESHLGEYPFTKKHKIFGEELEVKLDPGHTNGNIAKRIKTIRNALVNSSDRYERKERYIPSTNSENMLRREIPLLKYLAERVIIASAK
ncbi:MAG: hypothetical protein ABSA23_17380, partial [Anaerolineales bacterium]